MSLSPSGPRMARSSAVLEVAVASTSATTASSGVAKVFCDPACARADCPKHNNAAAAKHCMVDVIFMCLGSLALSAWIAAPRGRGASLFAGHAALSALACGALGAAALVAGERVGFGLSPLRGFDVGGRAI